MSREVAVLWRVNLVISSENNEIPRRCEILRYYALRSGSLRGLSFFDKDIGTGLARRGDLLGDSFDGPSSP